MKSTKNTDSDKKIKNNTRDKIKDIENRVNNVKDIKKKMNLDLDLNKKEPVGIKNKLTDYFNDKLNNIVYDYVNNNTGYKKINIYNNSIYYMQKIWIKTPILKIFRPIYLPNEKCKYSIPLTLLLPNTNKEMLHLHNFLKKVELKVSKIIKQTTSNKNLKLKSTIRNIDNFPPILYVEMPFTKLTDSMFEFNFQIYNSHNQRVNMDTLKNGVSTQIYMELSHVWISNDEYCPVWTVLQMKIYPELLFDKCLFADSDSESDSDNDSDNDSDSDNDNNKDSNSDDDNKNKKKNKKKDKKKDNNECYHCLYCPNHHVRTLYTFPNSNGNIGNNHYNHSYNQNYNYNNINNQNNNNQNNIPLPPPPPPPMNINKDFKPAFKPNVEDIKNMLTKLKPINKEKDNKINKDSDEDFDNIDLSKIKDKLN